MSFIIFMAFVRLAPYELRRFSLVSQLDMPITASWETIRTHLDCELLKDGTTRTELKQALRPFEPYQGRDFGFRNNSLSGRILIEFEGILIEDHSYSFDDKGVLNERSYISGLDVISIECDKE